MVNRTRGGAAGSTGTATSMPPNSAASASTSRSSSSPASTTATANRPSACTTWRSGKPSGSGPAGKEVRSDSCRSTSSRSAARPAGTEVPAGTGQEASLLICSGASPRMQRSMLSWPRVSGPTPLLAAANRTVTRRAGGRSACGRWACGAASGWGSSFRASVCGAASGEIRSCGVTSYAPFGSPGRAQRGCDRDATSGAASWSRPKLTRSDETSIYFPCM